MNEEDIGQEFKLRPAGFPAREQLKNKRKLPKDFENQVSEAGDDSNKKRKTTVNITSIKEENK